MPNAADPKLPTVSPAQGRVIDRAADSGRVTATRQTIAALMRARLVDHPTYRYGKGHSSAVLTELGQRVRARRAERSPS